MMTPTSTMATTTIEKGETCPRHEGDIGADNEADERRRESERMTERGGLTARGETSCRRGENVTKRGTAKPARGSGEGDGNARGERERSSSDGDLATAFMAFVAIGWEARRDATRRGGRN